MLHDPTTAIDDPAVVEQFWGEVLGDPAQVPLPPAPSPDPAPLDAGPLDPPPHPAKFSKPIGAAIQNLVTDLDHGSFILDPFAGVGTIHTLLRPDYRTVGVELEPEWAAQHPGTVEGNSLALSEMFEPEFFDGIVTSPSYGNRMADTYDGRDSSRRHTYRIDLGRPLTANSGAAMQWGAEYRGLHRGVWRESDMVLKPGGLVILNVANHVRKGAIQPVVEFHLGCFLDMGYGVEHITEIATPRMRHGANAELRVPEKILVLRKPL